MVDVNTADRGESSSMHCQLAVGIRGYRQFAIHWSPSFVVMLHNQGEGRPLPNVQFLMASLWVRFLPPAVRPPLSALAPIS